MFSNPIARGSFPLFPVEMLEGNLSARSSFIIFSYSSSELASLNELSNSLRELPNSLKFIASFISLLVHAGNPSVCFVIFASLALYSFIVLSADSFAFPAVMVKLFMATTPSFLAISTSTLYVLLSVYACVIFFPFVSSIVPSPKFHFEEVML